MSWFPASFFPQDKTINPLSNSFNYLKHFFGTDSKPEYCNSVKYIVNDKFLFTSSFAAPDLRRPKAAYSACHPDDSALREEPEPHLHNPQLFFNLPALPGRIGIHLFSLRLFLILYGSILIDSVENCNPKSHFLLWKSGLSSMVVSRQVRHEGFVTVQSQAQADFPGKLALRIENPAVKHLNSQTLTVI